MTITTNTTNALALAIAEKAYHLVSAVSRAIDTLKGWRAEAAAARELSRMDDRMLADLGIERSEIADVVSGLKAPSSAPAIKQTGIGALANDNRPVVAKAAA